jgi:hypothetical protein
VQQVVQGSETLPETFAIEAVETRFSRLGALQSTVASLANDKTYQAGLASLKSGARNLRVTTDDVAPFEFSRRVRSFSRSVEYFAMVQDLSGGAGGSVEDLGLVTSVVRGQDDEGVPHTVTTVEVLQKPSQPGFNLDQIRAEVIARDGQAIAAGTVGVRDIFPRFGACVKSNCGQPCLGALTGCVGAWPVYFECLVLACGASLLSCAGCAGCGCGIWCKWAVGCCQG